MLRGRYLFAAQKYRCCYTCTHCDSKNREYAFVRAVDPVRLNSFTDNLYDEMHLSGEIAESKAEKKFFHLQARANDNCWYAGLCVSGRCRKCGKRQIWSPYIRHTGALLMASACFLALIWLFGWPKDMSNGAVWVAGIIGLVLLCEVIGLLIAYLWARRQPDEYRPWLEAVYKKW